MSTSEVVLHKVTNMQEAKLALPLAIPLRYPFVQKVAPDQTTNRSFPFTFPLFPFLFLYSFPFLSLSSSLLFFSSSLPFLFLFHSFSFPLHFLSSSSPLSFLFFLFPILFPSSSQSFFLFSSFPFPFLFLSFSFPLPNDFPFHFPFSFPFPFLFRSSSLPLFARPWIAIRPPQKRYPIFRNQAKTISFDNGSYRIPWCHWCPTNPV